MKKLTKYCTFLSIICLMITLLPTSVLAQENIISNHRREINLTEHITELETTIFPINNIPLESKLNGVQRYYGTDKLLLMHGEPRVTGTSILIFLGGWLAGEVINGVFKAVTGTTPAEITEAAIKKAVSYITGKGSSSKSCNAYFDKNGNITNEAGCGFGGSSGGGWRLQLAQ